MRAILVDPSTPNRALRWQETAEPAIGVDDVIVSVRATALNRADLMQRAGHYPPPPGAPDILGLEMAGVIEEAGPGVSGWGKGDAVCALLPGGAMPSVAVPAAMLMPIPQGWTFAEAAALPEAYLTAFVNLYMEAALQPQESALVHGGASGVGTAAIQLLAATGNPVYVTAGSVKKCLACTTLGATAAINYKEEEWAARVKELTHGAGVDVILDMVGADYLTQNLATLKLKGRLVFISTLSGGNTDIDLRVVMGKRLRLIGSLLRSRTLVEKVAIKEAFVARFWPMLEAGLVKPVIDGIYPIAEAEAAHAQMAANQNIGKIVLAV
ncbi:MAG: NAD(P)H-quinone oxidoreductase [Anaerolineales bacterium]|nr:NAD(P)H-quinone oxidoreductase [Anaerolineales bacterium]